MEGLTGRIYISGMAKVVSYRITRQLDTVGKQTRKIEKISRLVDIIEDNLKLIMQTRARSITCRSRSLV